MAGRRTEPTASIILINYNGGRILPVIRQGIEGVHRQTMSDWELILVDDGSTDSSNEFLASFADGGRVRFVQAEHKGVGPARNAGLRLARGRLVAFLDNDAIPQPDWLERLVVFMDSHPDHGAAASLVMFADRPGVVNSAGCVLNELAHGIGVGMGQLYPYFSLPDEVLYATGNGMIIRRDVLDEVSWFDEGYRFYGHDDSDVGIRIRNAGYEIAPVHGAVLYHLHSVSKQEPGMNAWDQRNRIRFVLKHYSSRELLSFMLADVPRRMAGSRRREYLWEWRSALAGLGQLWRYRVQHRQLGPYFRRFARFFTPRHHLFIVHDNREYAQQWRDVGHGIAVGDGEEGLLYQGWYRRELRWGRFIRWAMPTSSLRFTSRPVEKITVFLVLHPSLERLSLQAHVYPWTNEWYLAPPTASAETVVHGQKGEVVQAVFRLPTWPDVERALLVFEAADYFQGAGYFPRRLAWGLTKMEVHPCAS